MLIDTSNAKRIYDEIGHDEFDKIVDMAKIIINNTEYKTLDELYGYLDINDAMKYVEDFFKNLNPEYYDRIQSTFNSNNSSNENSSSFLIKHVEDDEFGEFCGKNIFSLNTGNIIINHDNSIVLAYNSVHELTHRLASPNSKLDLERFFYKEVASITIESLFLDWMEDHGYNPEEIEQLRRRRKNNTYKNSSIIIFTNELIKSNQDKVSFDEIIKRIHSKYPNFNLEGLNMDLINRLYNDETNYDDYCANLMPNIPYIIGKLMSNYYIKDYYENLSDADIFKFIKLYSDASIDNHMTRCQYMLLNLPFENNNLNELEQLYDSDSFSDSDVIDIDYIEAKN